MTKKSQLFKVLETFIGAPAYSSKHRQIVDGYNAILPRPVGYKVTYDDDWCDIFVTYIADQIGLSQQIGRECGVERHRRLLKNKGLYLGRVQPLPGDILFFDWNGDGFCDHIGYVVKVQGGYLTTIEGNSLRMVRRVTYPLDHANIYGYARPVYELESSQSSIQGSAQVTHQLSSSQIDRLAQEVIRGKWGNGQARIQALKAAGYDPVQVQARVNQLIKG